MKKNLAILTVFLFSFAFLSVVVGIIEIGLMVLDTEIIANSDPKVMAGLIAEELVSAAIVLIISPFTSAIGLIILLFNKYRARWYFWTCLIFTLPYVFFFPIGTIVFSITWFYLLYKKREFNNNHPVNVAT
ncbi:hypothetical protein RI844_11675 [Thalassotalea fonticola]|uniref:DUF4064 domain-containing protein n=1 Tax=Thalassotalea fonticola TaxID=3065649 RepID=A0ABZ0GJT0_9GAMM|nr:hypothetical protein RI844_11675 [Colwelliaceae bacterium S1-1]